MKQGIQTGMREAPLFTVEDHLRVQQQIEARANELWRDGGCCDQSALNHWLRAEREVLEQFILAYDPRPSARVKPRRGRITGPKPPNQRTQLLKQRPGNKSQEHIETTVPP